MSLYCQLLEKSLGAIKIWKQTHVKKGIKYPRCYQSVDYYLIISSLERKLESQGAIKIQNNIR